MRRAGAALVIAVCAVAAGCTRSPVAPFVQQRLLGAGGGGPGPGPQPPPIPGPTSGFTLSGEVIEATPDGPQRLTTGRVNYLIEDTGDGTTGGVEFAEGRFVIPNIPPGRRVRITAFAWEADASMSQQTAASAIVDGNMTLDVELVRPEHRGIHRESPVLGGYVFQMTPEGRRPIVGTPVAYYSVYYGTSDVYTHTDGNGRFEFYRVRQGSGMLAAGSCNDAMQSIPVDITRDTTVEVDLTQMIAGCR